MTLSEREGRLLATMLNVLVAGLSDPRRLSRGRTYARQGAVQDLEIQPGLITGSVQGSRASPYEVAIDVDPATSFDTVPALMPARGDIDFTCSCPDWDDPCKHAVAVMVAFAEGVAADPPLLGLLRGEPQRGSGPRAVVGSRGAGRATAPPAVPARAPLGLDDAGRAALRAHLGEAGEYPALTVPTLAPPVAGWGELWAEMLGDALRVLSESAGGSGRR